jgi:hypothetical protein
VTNPAGTLQINTTTHLAQVGNNYFLDNVNSSGPELKYNGAAVTAGEFGTFTPIGAVQVAGGGYDIAWKDTATGQYTAWSTDSNGNYLSNLFAPVSGTSTVLESLETTFNQDLNGDGQIGIPPATKPAAVATVQNFQFTDQGNGEVGTSQQAAADSGTATVAGTTYSAVSGHETFAFAPNLGRVTPVNSDTDMETRPINQSAANLTSSLPAQDVGHAGAVITATTHDAVTMDHLTRPQLLAHHDFHFVF